ncbi:MAG: 3-isopropylmalate dehydrogenase [Rhodothermia bacterium]
MAGRRTYRIAVLPGDGIGPEVTEAAMNVVAAVSRLFEFEIQVGTHLVGGCAIEASGDPLPVDTVEACRRADAVLLGAVGGPAWDEIPVDRRPERGLLRLRSLLGVYANLRPVTTETIDTLIVRELTGGIYFGKPSSRSIVDGIETARDTMVYSRPEIERVARVAFEWAGRRRGKVTSVDKANVLETSRLWREVVSELRASDYPEVTLVHEYVDIAAMKLVSNPDQFDVVLTGNLFGDILSDLAASLPGSIGVLPSASLGHGTGLFEPVHGSAPDIAGLGLANPIGTIRSAAMMVDFLGEGEAAACIQNAVDSTIADGAATADLAPNLATDFAADKTDFLTTREMTEEILRRSVKTTSQRHPSHPMEASS